MTKTEQEINKVDKEESEPRSTISKKLEVAVFAGGCFWCTEAIFESLKGVVSVTSGYTGGEVPDPTYDVVSTGTSRHAESIKIEFDPEVITYNDLLIVFFNTHDPTTFNRQGQDAGSQYRSAIFYTSDAQKMNVEKIIKDMNDAHAYDRRIVTEVAPLGKFYPAEIEHQDYFKNNFKQPYCELVIAPKMEKLVKKFGELLK